MRVRMSLFSILSLFGLTGLAIYTEHIFVHISTLLTNLAESCCLSFQIISRIWPLLTASAPTDLKVLWSLLWVVWSLVSLTPLLPSHKLVYQPVWILSLLCLRTSNSSSFHPGKSQSHRRPIIICTLLALFIPRQPCWPPGFSSNRWGMLPLKPLFCMFPLSRIICMAGSFNSVKFWFECHLSMELHPTTMF